MASKKKAPIALFAFNRVDTLRPVLECLSKCEELTNGGRACYAFIDGPRNDADVPKVKEVLECIEEFRKDHFHTMKIIARETNLGNPRNMPMGISQVLDEHGRIIIIEDDILVSKYFLVYMDEALDLYSNDHNIWCINAWRSRYVKVPRDYRNDIYLNNRNMCWGWGTWKDRWESVDFNMSDYPLFISDAENVKVLDSAGIELKWMLDSQFKGRLHTWDVQCSYHMIKNRLWAVEPRYALTKNIGFATECAHCSGSNTAISTARFYNFRPRLTPHLPPSDMIVRQFKYAGVDTRFLGRVIRKIFRIVWGFGPRHDEPINLK